MIRLQGPPPLPVGYRVTLRNLIGITFLAVLAFVVIGAILVQLDPAIVSPNHNSAESLLWFALLTATGILAATGYVLAWRTSERWGIVGLVQPHPRWILIAVAAGVMLFFVGERADAVFRLGFMADFRATFGPAISAQIGLVSLLVAFAVVMPIAFEIYFRGLLFNYLSNRFGIEVGLFVSSLAFAGLFFHPHLPVSMLYGFVYGIVFALLFMRSGTLWTSIVANGTVGALMVAKAAWG